MLLLRSLALAAPAQDPPGAILPTTQAAAAASASATLGAADFATRLAESGNVYRQFTCEVEDIDATCPGVKALASVNAQEDLLKVPPNEKWLFYGPSYMLQMFQTVVTANTELIVEDGSFVDDNEEFAQMVSSRPAVPGPPASRPERSVRVPHSCHADVHSPRCRAILAEGPDCTGLHAGRRRDQGD